MYKILHNYCSFAPLPSIHFIKHHYANDKPQRSDPYSLLLEDCVESCSERDEKPDVVG